MRDEFVDLDLAVQVILNEAGKLRTALDTTEGTSFPDTTGNQLERCSHSVSTHFYVL